MSPDEQDHPYIPPPPFEPADPIEPAVSPDPNKEPAPVGWHYDNSSARWKKNAVT